MEQVLTLAAHYVSLALEAIAICMVAIGAAEALVRIFRVMFARSATNVEKRAIWLEFARWLVGALTFQLAADIVRTTVAPSWDDIGRVAAVAAIRTALTFFLDRDIDSVREFQHATAPKHDDARRA